MWCEFNGIPMFESLVNTEGIQTCISSISDSYRFESLVNTEGIQTEEWLP